MQGKKYSKKPILIKPRGVVTRRLSDVVAIEDMLTAKGVRYIRQHACEGVDVNDVAQHCGVSRRTLERTFGQFLGFSPHEQIVRTKVARAKELLMETDYPLDTIAIKSGLSPATSSTCSLSVKWKKPRTTSEGTRRTVVVDLTQYLWILLLALVVLFVVIELLTLVHLPDDRRGNTDRRARREPTRLAVVGADRPRGDSLGVAYLHHQTAFAHDAAQGCRHDPEQRGGPLRSGRSSHEGLRRGLRNRQARQRRNVDGAPRRTRHPRFSWRATAPTFTKIDGAIAYVAPLTGTTQGATPEEGTTDD